MTIFCPSAISMVATGLGPVGSTGAGVSVAPLEGRPQPLMTISSIAITSETTVFFFHRKDMKTFLLASLHYIFSPNHIWIFTQLSYRFCGQDGNVIHVFVVNK